MERNLITRIDTVERNLNARMDGLRTSMTAEYVCYQLCILLLLTHARRMNAEARIQNTKILADPEARLTPLVSYLSGEPIPNFPQTPQAIASFPGMTDTHAPSAAFPLLFSASR
jgi:hypothetical protein